MAASDEPPPKPDPVSQQDIEKSPDAEGARVVDHPPDEALASELASAVGKLVKREVAADMLGMPVTTFRRRVQGVEVEAVVVDGKYFFREVEIVELAVRYRRERYVEGGNIVPDDLGKLTAIVFDLFDQGVTPVDVVKRLEKPATVVEELHAQWVRMRGMVVLDGDQIRRLRSLDWTDREPMQLPNSDKLVRFIENLHVAHEVEALNCERCHAARARVCANCHRLQPERIKAEARRYAEDAKMARAHYDFMRAPIQTTVGGASSRSVKSKSDDTEDGDESGKKRRR